MLTAVAAPDEDDAAALTSCLHGGNTRMGQDTVIYQLLARRRGEAMKTRLPAETSTGEGWKAT